MALLHLQLDVEIWHERYDLASWLVAPNEGPELSSASFIIS